MEKILSLVKKIVIDADCKQEKYKFTVEFFEQKETAAVVSSDCPKKAESKQ